MMKKEIPEVLVRSVIVLCERVKIRVRVDSELSEKLEVKAVMQNYLCCHLFFLHLWQMLPLI